MMKPDPRTSTESRFAGWATVVFAALLAVGVMRHEIWRDEAKAFVIARDSASSTQLLSNIEFEGHPVGWYLVLFALTRLTSNLLAMQVVNIWFVAGGIYFFARFAKLPRWQRALFCFGYFPLFEYGLVARSYGLGLFLLFAACAAFTQLKSARIRVWSLAILLGLLANTSLYGLLLATAFGAAATYVALRRGSASDHPACPGLKGHSLVAALLLLAMMSISALTIAPPSHMKSPQRIGDARFSGSHPVRAVGTFWRTVFPVPPVVQRGLMSRSYGLFHGELSENDNADVRADPFGGPTTPGGTISAKPTAGAQRQINRVDVAICIASVAALALFTLRFLHSPSALIFFVVSVGLILILTGWRFPGALRHHGHLYLAVIGAVWLARGVLPRNPQPSLKSTIRRVADALLAAMIVVQAVAGVAAYGLDLARPFSASRQAASFVRSHYPPNVQLIATPGDLLSPLCALLDTRGYIPSQSKWASFVTLDGQPKRATGPQLDDAFGQLCRPGKPPVLLLTDLPLDYRPRRASVREVARFTETLISERYFIYEVTAEPASTQPTAETP